MRSAFATEQNLKIHTLMAVIVVGMGVYFGITAGEWIAVVLCIGLVFALELINTAIEELVDLVKPGHDVRAGKIKDVAAGAVLVAALIAVVVAVIIFWKYLLK